jgi:CheY-like chemotaxis protein
LVADDNPRWLQMLVSIVEQKFEVVATALDGESALRAIFHHKPDVAVVDVGMPGLSGIEIARQLMSHGSKPPVVICSAETAQESVEAAREAGAAGYVYKHCCARDLLPALDASQKSAAHW